MAAVYHALDKVSGIVFREPGEIELHGNLTVAADAPAIVLIG